MPGTFIDSVKSLFIRRNRILSSDDEGRIRAVIAEAEKGNCGEVRLHMEWRCPIKDTLRYAEKIFKGLRMDKTKGGTGVLLYVAVDDRSAVVFAGPGIHGAADPSFWKSVTDTVAGGFSRGEPAAGLVEAISEIGRLLRKAVPGEDRAGNELPDEISGMR